MKVTHDIHNHTLFSSCCYDPEATMAAFVKKAHELGHTVLGISNHLWDEKAPGASGWYKGQTIDYGFEGKYAIPSDTMGVRVLFGTESEYCGMSGRIGMTAETAKRFDYVLIPHTHTHMKNFVIADDADTLAARAAATERLAAAFPELCEDTVKKMASQLKRPDLLPLMKEKTIDYEQYMADFMFTSFESLLENPEFVAMSSEVPTLVAHPFFPCGESKEVLQRIIRLALKDRERLYEDFKKAARMDVGMDINIGTYKSPENGYADDPMAEVMRIALDAGCKFAFGTDSHSVVGLENIRKGDIISEAIGITEKHLIDLVR